MLQQHQRQRRHHPTTEPPNHRTTKTQWQCVPARRGKSTLVRRRPPLKAQGQWAGVKGESGESAESGDPQSHTNPIDSATRARGAKPQTWERSNTCSSGSRMSQNLGSHHDALSSRAASVAFCVVHGIISLLENDLENPATLSAIPWQHGPILPSVATWNESWVG
jgi:hypothetical protein